MVQQLREHMPIRWRSPNQIDPTATFTAFLMSVLVGAKRFAHAGLLRGGRVLHTLVGLDRFPTDDRIPDWQIPTSPKLDSAFVTCSDFRLSR